MCDVINKTLKCKSVNMLAFITLSMCDVLSIYDMWWQCVDKPREKNVDAGALF